MSNFVQEMAQPIVDKLTASSGECRATGLVQLVEVGQEPRPNLATNIQIIHTKFEEHELERFAVRMAENKAYYFGNVFFNGVTLRGINFYSIEFYKCTFSKCYFENCTFVKCQFRQCTMSDVEFRQCQIYETPIYGGHSRDLKFTETCLSHVDYHNSLDSDIVFYGCEITHVDFMGSVFQRVNSVEREFFPGCDLSYCILDAYFEDDTTIDLNRLNSCTGDGKVVVTMKIGQGYVTLSKTQFRVNCTTFEVDVADEDGEVKDQFWRMLTREIRDSGKYTIKFPKSIWGFTPRDIEDYLNRDLDPDSWAEWWHKYRSVLEAHHRMLLTGNEWISEYPEAGGIEIIEITKTM